MTPGPGSAPRKTGYDSALHHRGCKIVFPPLCADITLPAPLFKYLFREAIFRDYLALKNKPDFLWQEVLSDRREARTPEALAGRSSRQTRVIDP